MIVLHWTRFFQKYVISYSIFQGLRLMHFYKSHQSILMLIFMYLYLYILMLVYTFIFQRWYFLQDNLFCKAELRKKSNKVARQRDVNFSRSIKIDRTEDIEPALAIATEIWFQRIWKNLSRPIKLFVRYGKQLCVLF